MFTILKHLFSVVIWVIVGAALLIAKSPELFAFWALVGIILLAAWVIKFIWKWIVGIFFPTVSARSYFFTVLFFLIVALALYQLILVPAFVHWGITEDELKREYAIDELLPEARTETLRGFTVEGPVERVYPLISRLVTEGVLTFDINLIDFIRNKPAQIVLKDIPAFEIGDRFLVGEIVQSKKDQGVTVELSRHIFPWNKFKKIYAGYYLDREGRDKTRVIMKIKADYDGFLAWFCAKYLIEFGDYWVSRYYAHTIKSIVEGSSA
jgi:hypothetical protein